MRDFEHKSRSKILTSQPENPFRDYLVCEKQQASAAHGCAKGENNKPVLSLSK